MDEIVARYHWTADALIAARRWHYRHSMRPFFRATILAMSCFALLAGVCMVATGEFAEGMMVAGFGSLMLLGRATSTPWFVQRQFRQRTDQDDEFVWQFTRENIQINTSHSRTECDWSAFQKIVKTPDGYLIYPNPQIFHWLPREAFASDVEFARLSQLAEEHGVRVLDISGESFRQRFRFQTKNILWAITWSCIWAAAFSFLKTFIVQHRPLGDLPWSTMAVAVYLPLLLIVSMPAVAIGALFGRTRAGALVGLMLVAVCFILALAIML
jgi:hypothetical protein